MLDLALKSEKPLSALPKPSYEAHVSPELVLLRMTKAKETRADDLAEQTSSSDAPSSDEHAPLASRSMPGFESVSLRRDGRRPLRILAGLVFKSSTVIETDIWVEQTLRLYVKPDGGLVAQLQLEPGEDFARRPVWRATELFSELDFGKFLRDAHKSLMTFVNDTNKHQTKPPSDPVRAAYPPIFAQP